jgi:hypothetical protein
MKKQLLLGLLSCLVLPGAVVAETFVVNKKKPQNQSLYKLKENYADELAELVRIIPDMQKQLADLQQRCINELSLLLDDDMKLSKAVIDGRTCKAQELRCFMEHDYQHVLPAKAAFIPQAAKLPSQPPTAKVAQELQTR